MRDWNENKGVVMEKSFMELLGFSEGLTFRNFVFILLAISLFFTTLANSEYQDTAKQLRADIQIAQNDLDNSRSHALGLVQQLNDAKAEATAIRNKAERQQAEYKRVLTRVVEEHKAERLRYETALKDTMSQVDELVAKLQQNELVIQQLRGDLQISQEKLDKIRTFIQSVD